MGALWRAPWRHSLEMIKIVPFYAWHILPWQTLNQRLLLILRLIPTCCMVDFMVILDITDIPMVTELGMSMERERPNLLLNLKLILRLILTCRMVDSMVIVDIMDIPMVMVLDILERERPNLLLNLRLILKLILICCMVDSMAIVDIMDIPMEHIMSASKGKRTTKFTLLFEQRL